MTWLSANGYLGARILGGALIFAGLAWFDIWRNGRAATRWREYSFLLFCVVVAMGYGVLNDQVSVTISWEYFYYGKDQAAALGPDTPPAELPLRLRAAVVGMMATWSAGLLIGVALLVANNPWKNLPRVSYRRLMGVVPVVVGVTVICAAIGALLGYHGYLDWVQSDFGEIRRTNLWRPARFIGAWGEHLGAYAGGVIGLAWAVVRVVRWRLARRPGGFDVLA